MNEQVSKPSAEEASGFPPAEPASQVTAGKLDRARAVRELEEARRLYDVAALVHERSGLGSTDSAPIAHKALLVLLRLIVRLHGVEPGSESALIAQVKQLNEKESLFGYDATEDLAIIAQAKDRFFEADGDANRADGRRYDRAFIRCAKLFGATQDHIGELMPGTRPSPLRHWKIAAVVVIALGVGYGVGARGKTSALPALPPVVAAGPEPPKAAAGGPAASAGGKLETTLFRDPELKQAAVTRTDSALDFNWAVGEPPELGQNDHFSVRWAGKLGVPERGSYEFYLTSDDGSRLFIGDNLVVDNWGVHTVETKQGSVELEAGVHAFRVEYFDGTGDAVIKLEWSSNTLPRRVISAQDLK